MSKSGGKWSVLIVLSLAIFIMVLDTTMMNVSISALVNDLHTEVKSIQMVITVYALVMAAFMVTGSKLGDIFGRKRVFVIGAMIYGVGSLIACLSVNVSMLMLGWAIIEGFGAALMMPATATLLMENYHGKERAQSFGVWAGVAASGAAFGPIFGGLLTTYLSWRWAFGLEVVIIAAILLTSHVIAKSTHFNRLLKIDWPGVALSAAGLALVVYGLIEASDYGWWHASQPYMIFGHEFAPLGLSITPISIFVGFVILAIWGVWSQHLKKIGRDPLIDFAIFKNASFSSGISTSSLLNLVLAGAMFIIPLFLQLTLGYDAFTTGLTILPLSVGIMIISMLTTGLGAHIAPKRIIQGGLVIVILGLWWLNHSFDPGMTGLQLAPALAVIGIGTGFVFSQVTNISLSALPPEKSTDASGVLNTCKNLGTSLGTAILGTVLMMSALSNLQKEVEASTVLPEDTKQEIVVHLQQNTKQMTPEEKQHFINEQTPATAAELNRIKGATAVDAMISSVRVLVAFGVLTLLVSVKLPSKKMKVDPEEAVLAVG